MKMKQWSDPQVVRWREREREKDIANVTGVKESDALVVCDRGLAVYDSRYHWCRRLEGVRSADCFCQMVGLCGSRQH